jgi:hypothetical protein
MSRLGTPDYRIGKLNGVCAATGRKLAVGERFVAALAESAETEDLIRMDYSLEAWEQGARPEGGRLFGFWRAVVPESDAKQRVLIDDDAIVDLFEQLAETTDPKRVAFRFVLALVLIRKKLLTCESSRAPRAKATGDGGEGVGEGGSEPGALLVRRRGDPRPPEGPPLMEVIDPGLTDEAIDDVIQQFEAVMSGEISTEPPPAKPV